ncbi:hypothetical protein FANTH_10150 [Fusarium anthophilum]|uniref:Uncharacterized protein n=1 Tax=Fusarium anthophilum TaxID=48485 RepID=A0A8H5DX34_9HYPO|nr:hypothetical protein FANTH_10150 [Fusarium anthophilum]
MGYRYVSNVCIPDDADPDPKRDPHTYLPTTWPGSRAPHVFLKDGNSILDLLGSDFFLVEFKDEPDQQIGSDLLVTVAKELGVHLVSVTLVGEANAAMVWQKKLVLVRPGGHVAWRGSSVGCHKEAKRILETAIGRHC